MSFPTKKLVRAGIIAALYVLLSLAVFPVASGAIQFRASEALTLLPLLYAEAIPALAVGCMLSNLLTGCAVLDVVFGSVITLVAAILTFFIGKLFKNVWVKCAVGGIFPVVLNAFFLPVIWYFCYGELEYLYIVQVAFLLLSQTAVIYALGMPLTVHMNKLKEKGVGFLQP